MDDKDVKFTLADDFSAPPPEEQPPKDTAEEIPAEELPAEEIPAEVPAEYPAAPEEYPAAPAEYPAAPEEYPAAPEEYPAAPAEYPAAPEEYPAAPEEYPAAPEELPAAAEESAGQIPADDAPAEPGEQTDGALSDGNVQAPAEETPDAAETPAPEETARSAREPLSETDAARRKAAVYEALRMRSRNIASETGDQETVRPVMKFDEHHSRVNGVRLHRRKPHRNRFLRGMLIYCAVMFLILGALVCVGWKYAGMYADSRAEKYVADLAVNTTEDGWRQLLRQKLPDSWPVYEDGARLACDVLSPAFHVGKVTYIRYAGREGDPVFGLFSDGSLFAVMELKDRSPGVLGLSEWEIGKMTFRPEYFADVDFPERVVTLPLGAELYVNSDGPIPASAENGAVLTSYPEVSPAEREADVAPCVELVFRDIYFEPALRATLNGEELEMVRAGDNAVYFRYPESATHSVTVTVPEGVTARAGGVLLTDEWCGRTSKEGELGALDSGGTGTLPVLSVWTVKGLFGEPKIEAEVYGTEVKLLSSEGGNYVFDTPAECKYTVSVIVPRGAAVSVNGRAAGAELLAPEGAGMEELGRGKTVLGRYEVAELSAVPGAVPEFDKYVLTGYLAMPAVTASLNGAALETAGITVNEYDVVWEFDCPVSDAAASDDPRAASAMEFARDYLKYICEGGAWEQPENAATFDANYEALRSKMVMGTSGYVGIMESYRTVNKLPHYDYFRVDSLTADRFIAYTDSCVSCRVNYSVSRVRNMPAAETTPTETAETEQTGVADGTQPGTGEQTAELPDPEILSGSIMVLQVLYKNEWRIWGFLFE